MSFMCFQNEGVRFKPIECHQVFVGHENAASLILLFN